MRGFWNDPDGWSLSDVVTVVALPVWMYVAVKFALSSELSANQVDYFLVLSYPLLIAVGGKAIGNLPLPWPRRSGFGPVQQEYCPQNSCQAMEIAPEKTAYEGTNDRPTI